MKVEEINVDNLTNEEVIKLASKYHINISDYYEDTYIDENNQEYIKDIRYYNAQELIDYINEFATKHNKNLSKIKINYDEETGEAYLSYHNPKSMERIREEVKFEIDILVKKKQSKSEKAQKNKLAKFEKLKKELGE